MEELTRFLHPDYVECQQCDLCDDRKRMALGEGDPNANIMIIGEAPGSDENRLGRPFVGMSGKVLTNLLVMASACSELAIYRKDQSIDYEDPDEIRDILCWKESIYITNAVLCRPPSDAQGKPTNPQARHIKACMKRLEYEIRKVDPMVILSLGALPATALTKKRKPVSELRRRPHDASITSTNPDILPYVHYPVFTTYHPAFLLKIPDSAPEWKWSYRDIYQAMRAVDMINEREFGIDIPLRLGPPPKE